MISIHFYDSGDSAGGVVCGPYRAIGARDDIMFATAPDLSIPLVARQVQGGWMVYDCDVEQVRNTFSIYPHDTLHGEQEVKPNG